MGIMYSILITPFNLFRWRIDRHIGVWLWRGQAQKVRAGPQASGLSVDSVSMIALLFPGSGTDIRVVAVEVWRRSCHLMEENTAHKHEFARCNYCFTKRLS